MANVLIGAIGTNMYKEASYQFAEGLSAPTPFFLSAYARRISPPVQVYVLVTPEARDANWIKVQEALLAVPGVSVEAVAIEKGANDAELWQNFTVITSCVQPGDVVYFDITNALRSLPLLLINAVAYLRSARNIEVREICYGAYDAVSPDVIAKPVFRLDPFITLSNWSHAVEVFKRTGDCAIIAQLLNERHEAFYSDDRAQTTGRPTRLKNVATTLKALSLALDLARPLEVMDAATRLQDHLDHARAEGHFVPPFVLLIQQIEDEFAPFALRDAEAKRSIPLFLRKTAVLMRWCIAHERFAAAALLAREWLVSWYCYHEMPDKDIFDQDHRKKAEDRMTANDALTQDQHRLIFARRMFMQYGDFRNDLAHVGMRKNADQAKILADKIKAFVQALADGGTE